MRTLLIKGATVCFKKDLNPCSPILSNCLHHHIKMQLLCISILRGGGGGGGGGNLGVR